MLTLALDLGTSSCRSALFNVRGRRLLGTTAQQSYELDTDKEGKAELDAGTLLHALQACIRTTLATHDGDRRLRSQHIAAVGTSCFGHSLIGTDAGFRAPLRMLNFLISPAERYELIVDFSQMPMGTTVTLTNYNAPVHYPDGDGPEISEVMQFQVTKPLSGADRTTPPEKLRLPAVALVTPKPQTRRREWVVYQHQLFGTMTFNAVPFAEPSQDFIKAGSTEIWEYINPNHDALNAKLPHKLCQLAR